MVIWYILGILLAGYFCMVASTSWKSVRLLDKKYKDEFKRKQQP